MALRRTSAKRILPKLSRYQLELYVTQASKNPKNNTSHIQYEIGVRKLKGTGYWSRYKTTWSANINGVRMSGTIPKDSRGYSYDFRRYSYLKIKSGSLTVKHNSNGKKTMKASASFHANYSGGIGSATASTSFVLEGIDRKTPTLRSSVLSVSDTTARIRITSSNPINDFQYQVNGGSWKSSGGINKRKDITVTGLAPNRRFTFRPWGRRSYNSVAGYGSTISGTTQARAPGRPSITATSIKTNSITVRASSSAGANSPVRQYRFYCSLTGSWTGWGSGNTYTFGGLSSNKSYTIKAQARTDGNITSSQGSISIRTDSAPPSGGSISVTSISQGHANISMRGVSSQIGIKEYRYYINNTHKKTGTSSERIDGLTPGTRYSVRVRAIDHKGRYVEKTSSFYTKHVPIKPSDVSSKVSSIGEDYVTIEMKASAPAGIKSYKIDVQGVGTSGAQTGNTHQFKGLSSNTSYRYTALVTDNEGNTASHTGSFKTHAKAASINSFYLDSIGVKDASVVGIYSTDADSASAWVEIDDRRIGLDHNGRAKIDNLEPNTEYRITLVVQNGDASKKITRSTIIIKTKEDKWVYISVDGGSFEKVNLYVIKDSGRPVKIEKSMRKII